LEKNKSKGGETMNLNKKVKPLFMMDDEVEISGYKKTCSYLGGTLERMSTYKGKQGRITRVYASGVVQVSGVPYSWLQTEVKLLNRIPKPPWVQIAINMGEGKSSSHPLRYCVYNSRLYPDGPPGPHIIPWTTSGYCFQSYGSSLSGNQSGDRLRWEFIHRPHTNFQRTTLSKATIKWWLNTWRKFGAFPKGVTTKDLVDGVLDMRVRDENGIALPSNRVYLSVSLNRYIHEVPDLLNITRYLTEKVGMHFFTAVAFASLLGTTSRGHSLFGGYVMPTSQPLPMFVKAAIQARTIAKYFEYRANDTNKEIFKWWATVKLVSRMQTPEGRTEIDDIKKRITEASDLETYNPMKGTTNNG
jgi:hypothetical protein